MVQPTKQDVEDRFAANIGRVRNLVNTYNTLVGPGAGRPSVEHADILRAAVLLLHAALEDLLRSIEELRLPGAAPDSLERIRLAPHGSSKEPKEKFTLVELAAYRGQSVNDVIRKAVDLHLEHSNYNNVGDVKQALSRAGVSYTLAHQDAATLQAMMSRRNWIAHRADRNTASGRGHHTAQSIGRTLVDGWTSVVESFGKAVLATF